MVKYRLCHTLDLIHKLTLKKIRHPFYWTTVRMVWLHPWNPFILRQRIYTGFFLCADQSWLDKLKTKHETCSEQERTPLTMCIISYQYLPLSLNPEIFSMFQVPNVRTPFSYSDFLLWFCILVQSQPVILAPTKSFFEPQNPCVCSLTLKKQKRIIPRMDSTLTQTHRQRGWSRRKCTLWI